MRYAWTPVLILFAANAAAAQDCEKWEWNKNQGGKEWKKVLTLRCIKDIPKKNKKLIFFVGSAGN